VSHEAFLVCLPADASVSVPGARFDRRCSRCSRRVMMAPTSAPVLEEFPGIKILCVFCFSEHAAANAEEYRAPTEEQLAELKTAIPNPWRGRN
jgi:hypothetical protein